MISMRARERGTARRLAGLVTAFLVLLLAAAAPVAAAETVDFQLVIRETFGRGNAPTQVGHLRGVTVTQVFTFSHAVSTGDEQCPAVSYGTSVTTWPDGSTVTTDEAYLICFPGSALSAPDSARSYGNPEFSLGTFTVSGGTGQFAGITGSGTIRVAFAGDVLIAHYSGSVTIP